MMYINKILTSNKLGFIVGTSKLGIIVGGSKKTD